LKTLSKSGSNPAPRFQIAHPQKEVVVKFEKLDHYPKKHLVAGTSRNELKWAHNRFQESAQETWHSSSNRV
jgi:hypothetical protein